MGVADAYVAMSSPRAYRGPMPAPEIVNEVRRLRGAHYDPDAADALVRLVECGELA